MNPRILLSKLRQAIFLTLVFALFSEPVLAARHEQRIPIALNDEGSALVGRILNFGVDMSDEALVALKRVSDDLVESGVKLSDEAAQGVGVLAKNVEPEELTKFTDEMMAVCGATSYAPTALKIKAIVKLGNLSDCVNRVESLVGKLNALE